MAFRTLRISELAPISAVDGRLLWHPLRHALGVTAFGVNAYTAPTAGQDVLEEHTEGSPCCEAQLGRLDAAIAHLGEALADDPRVREWSAGDPDLDPLRTHADFPL